MSIVVRSRTAPSTPRSASTPAPTYDGALSEPEIAAQRRWLARSRNAHTIAGGQAPARSLGWRPGGLNPVLDPDAERERAWLVEQTRPVQAPQESP
ncbi:hypothetical protein [Nonomuraea dietziae]|uniref:hypothetical protein n=1 Tax=Nonomuraea dietziae TaxID=65515 RepID=UPI0033F4DACD